MKISQRTFGSIGSLIFLSTACLGVCTIYFKNIEYLTLFLSIVFLWCGGAYDRLKKNKYLNNILLFFYCPVFISLFWAILKTPFVNDSFYYEYIGSNMLTRVAHILLFIIVFYGILQICNRYRDNGLFYSLSISYAYGVLIFLGIMGIWQIAHQVTGIWCPELETRNDLYFARSLGISRITSFADEPSYLAPFLIDAIIIFLFFRKYSFAFCLLVLLGFSLSFGGYVEVFVLSVYILFHLDIKLKIKIIVSSIIILAIILILFPDLIDYFEIILSSRKELQSGASLSDTSRTAMLLQPISGFLNSDWVSKLIGNGPSSLYYFYWTFPEGALFVTSNNYFVDSLYENGILGLIAYFYLFAMLWKSANKVYVKKHIISLFPKLLMLHIALSSLYRADYSSARYPALFILLFCLINILKNKNGFCNHPDLSTKRVSMGMPQES